MQDNKTSTPDSLGSAYTESPRAGGGGRVGSSTPQEATKDGTARLRKRFASRYVDDFYRTGPRHVAISSLGVGTYLGAHTDADDAAYVEALRHAFGEGLNVVDSAINYRCQRSERAIGQALRDAIAAGQVRRDEVVVCTKGGFVPLDGAPPPTKEAYQAYLQSTYIDTGVMRPDDLVAGGHCIAPSFLADQVRRSRENLGLKTLDVYYVHNPEQQLVTVSREELLRRLRDAFAELEARADAGEIGTYGVATWQGLRVAAGDREHLSITDLVLAARDVAGYAHRFRAIQLPVSLAMPEGIRLEAQALVKKKRATALEAAVEYGLTVTASAPLMQGRLTQGLPPTVSEIFPGLRTDAQRALAFARALPEVQTVLVGMRTAEHLAENLEGVRRPPRG